MGLPVALNGSISGVRGGVARILATAAIAAVGVLATSTEGALAASARPLSASSLDFPAAFTVTPYGARILYAERFTGRIRWLDPNTGATTPFFTVPNVADAGEQGLLGLAFRPDYPGDRRVWAYVTRTVGGIAQNQLIRIRADGSRFTVLRNLPTGEGHDGGRIAFGPDGKLYVVIGDNGSPANSQSMGTLAGKILRLNADGAVPVDNPRAGSPIIAYGIRNSFGFTFDRKTGRLWETENGPDCNDEINLVARLKLQNFGWGPSQSCASPPAAPRNTNRDGPSPLMPKYYFPNPPALTGAAFCRDCGLDSPGRLFVGDFNTGTIRRARLNSARTGIASLAPFYNSPHYLVSLETPLKGGPIYFSTTTNIFRLNP